MSPAPAPRPGLLGAVAPEALEGAECCGALSAAGGRLGDVVTYMHLATVVSASEFKGASLWWWNMAWSLARELRLGRELPPSEPRVGHEGRGVRRRTMAWAWTSTMPVTTCRAS